MSDEILLHGKQYVSSKKAAEVTGYARDYIGQLSRGGLIDAERVGGLWYVSIESLNSYEKNADSARSLTPAPQSSKEAESSLVFEGKDYISASRASKISGYNQDYVGQLARGGKIPSRQIGNRWYVDQEALLAHKREKDALLAAVQSESVGLAEAPAQPVAVQIQPPVARNVRYMPEERDLIPILPEKKPAAQYPVSNFSEVRPEMRPEIRPLSASAVQPLQAGTAIDSPVRSEVAARRAPLRRSKPRRRLAGASLAVLTIILVLSVGFTATRHTQVFANTAPAVDSMTAAAGESVDRIGDMIENRIAPEMHYQSDTK